MNRPPTDDLIQDLLPDSSSAYMLICGRSGIGKTFLALNVLYCLATGVPFLSHKTKPCKVGYLSMEGSDRKILKQSQEVVPKLPGDWIQLIKVAFQQHYLAIVWLFADQCQRMGL